MKTVLQGYICWAASAQIWILTRAALVASRSTSGRGAAAHLEFTSLRRQLLHIQCAACSTRAIYQAGTSHCKNFVSAQGSLGCGMYHLQ